MRPDIQDRFGLFVKKGVLSEDFSIAPTSSWSDFVFATDYELPNLQDVEYFVTNEQHLPGVPSQKEVAQNGYSQHEMNKVLLQKIEELTLYVIQQKKEIERLNKMLEMFKRN